MLQLPITVSYGTTFTADYIDEQQQDSVLPASGVLTFADLGVKPKKISVGLPVEHLRHFRVGGYDFGTTSQTTTTGGAGFG